MRARAAAEMATTFVTSFAASIGLADVLDPNTVRAYARKAHGRKASDRSTNVTTVSARRSALDSFRSARTSDACSAPSRIPEGFTQVGFQLLSPLERQRLVKALPL